jgi:hypothetical protein
MCRTVIAAALLLLDTAACQSAADACTSAGGQCVLGTVTTCARRGDSCQSTPPTPGGSYCCFAFLADAGADGADADQSD